MPWTCRTLITRFCLWPSLLCLELVNTSKAGSDSYRAQHFSNRVLKRSILNGYILKQFLAFKRLENKLALAVSSKTPVQDFRTPCTPKHFFPCDSSALFYPDLLRDISDALCCVVQGHHFLLTTSLSLEFWDQNLGSTSQPLWPCIIITITEVKRRPPGSKENTS